jgi:hypothetical protein
MQRRNVPKGSSKVVSTLPSTPGFFVDHILLLCLAMTVAAWLLAERPLTCDKPRLNVAPVPKPIPLLHFSAKTLLSAVLHNAGDQKDGNRGSGEQEEQRHRNRK